MQQGLYLSKGQMNDFEVQYQFATIPFEKEVSAITQFQAAENYIKDYWLNEKAYIESPVIVSGGFQ